jgi:putative membrane protein
MFDKLLLFFKGVAMGAANVVPGVSGGTIAFITNIYDELINSLKSFDLKAIKLLASFKFHEFSNHVNLRFLFVLFSGVFLSIISFGKLLSYLFSGYPVYVWAFFFGLILASVYFVGKNIHKWDWKSWLPLLVGTLIAVIIAYLNPANENENSFYLFLCGIIAMASMLLPGLSGSFVLILMGNYQLIFLEAVPEFNLRILIPVVLGSGVGFVLLSRIISFLLGKFRDSTVGLLTGFILGSLLIIWPWKRAIYLVNEMGEMVLKNGKQIIESYEWFAPDLFNHQTWIAAVFILFGIVVVILIEGLARLQKS